MTLGSKENDHRPGGASVLSGTREDALADPAAVERIALRPKTTLPGHIARFVRRQPLGSCGAILILLLVIVAALAPWLAPQDPYRLDSSRILLAPNSKNLLGTDQFGRDLLSRIIWGARVSMYVGLASVGLGVTAGAVIGAVGAYFGGIIDSLIQRVMDALLAFPTLVLAMTMVAVLGASQENVILALAVVSMPSAARVIRSSVLSLREMAFVEAARSLGNRHWRILLVHILRNCVAPYIVLATAGLGSAILSEASLSFLGLGTPAPTPSWGAMLSGQALRYVRDAPWLVVFPGLAITIAVFGFNLFGDALRDALDPRLRGR
jgi:peptide/nickel transport system permease protein